MTYFFTKQADKALQELPIGTQQFIIHKIKHYLASGDPLHYADSIKSEKGKVYRFRTGDYRVIFDWNGDHILVTKVVARKEAY